MNLIITYLNITALRLACDRNNYDILNFLLQLPDVQIIPRCFQNCSKLTQLAIPESVTSIGKFAFSNCVNLKTVTIPSTVTLIEKYAFENCSSLKEITISSSIKTICFGAFNGCTSLKSITFEQPSDNINKCAHLIGKLLMKNCHMPNYKINGNKMILDGTYHDVELANRKINGEYFIRIAVLGKCYAGKSTFIDRYITGDFIISDPPGCIDMKSKHCVISGNNMEIQFLDVTGVRYENLMSFYHDIDGAVIIFDVSNTETFDEVQYLYNAIKDNDQVPKILVGCKCDMEYQVDRNKIDEIAKANDSKYFEVSARENININETAEYIIREAFKYSYYAHSKEENGINIHIEEPNRPNKGCWS